ncbi:MAG: hypothetical protein R3Y28_02005 [Candidatus Gastranaerophilales bacterium]
MKEILFYSDENGKIPYLDWYNTLDKSIRIVVDKRISKIERDLYGDFKKISQDLFEFKFSNGIRIYFTEVENVIVLLLTGGNKSR